MRIDNFSTQFLTRGNARPFHVKQEPSDLEKNQRGVSGLAGLVHNTAANGKAVTAKDRIQSLMDRKQSITDMKREYMENARADGVPDEVVQEKLKDYDAMLEQVNTDIAKVQQEEQEKQTEKTRQEGRKAAQNAEARAPKDAQSAQQDANAQLIGGLTKLSQGKEAIHSIRTARQILKGQALSQSGSSASPSPPEKTLAKGYQARAAAESLEGRVLQEAARMRGAAKKVTEATGAAVSANAAPKDYRQQAIENYAAIAGGNTQEEPVMDLMA